MGWSSSTSASTTPPVSPTRRSCPTRRAPRRRASCAVLSTGSKEWEFGPSRCSQTTAPVTAPAYTLRPARSSRCATLHPHPYRPRAGIVLPVSDSPTKITDSRSPIQEPTNGELDLAGAEIRGRRRSLVPTHSSSAPEALEACANRHGRAPSVSCGSDRGGPAQTVVSSVKRTLPRGSSGPYW